MCKLFACLDIWDKQTARLQKTRKTTAKMGRIVWISKEGRGGRKVEREGQQQGAMENNNESSHTAEWQLTSLAPRKGKPPNAIVLFVFFSK